MLQCGSSVTSVAADLHVSRQTLYDLKRAAAKLPSGRTPPRKVDTRVKKKTTARTDALMQRDVMIDPSITAAVLKACTTSTERVLLGLFSTDYRRI